MLKTVFSTRIPNTEPQLCAQDRRLIQNWIGLSSFGLRAPGNDGRLFAGKSVAFQGIERFHQVQQLTLRQRLTLTQTHDNRHPGATEGDRRSVREGCVVLGRGRGFTMERNCRMHRIKSRGCAPGSAASAFFVYSVCLSSVHTVGAREGLSVYPHAVCKPCVSRLCGWA